MGYFVHPTAVVEEAEIGEGTVYGIQLNFNCLRSLCIEDIKSV